MEFALNFANGSKLEESSYKPETTVLCVMSRSKNVVALIIAPKE